MRAGAVSTLATVILAGGLASANAAESVSPAALRDASTGSNAASTAPPAASSRPQFRIRPADEGWGATLPRDADAAKQAYLDRLPIDVVARSNAYFEGGYWLQLWNLLLGLAVAIFLLAGRRSARMRDWAQRVGRKPFLRDACLLYTSPSPR